MLQEVSFRTSVQPYACVSARIYQSRFACLRCEHRRCAVATEANSQQREYVAKARIERKDNADGAREDERHFVTISHIVDARMA